MTVEILAWFINRHQIPVFPRKLLVDFFQIETHRLAASSFNSILFEGIGNLLGLSARKSIRKSSVRSVTLHLSTAIRFLPHQMTGLQILTTINRQGSDVWA